MKILIVSRSSSIHTARWLAQFADSDWEIHLFPLFDINYGHPDLASVTIHYSPTSWMPLWLRKLYRTLVPSYRARQLCRLINRLNPDILHSTNLETSSRLIVAAKKRYRKKFPTWLATNWGSDLYYFADKPQYKKHLRAALTECDFYSCECTRDIHLARNLGLKGRVLPAFPNAGGFDLELVKEKRVLPPSKRKLIMLKGYHHFVGRALIALEVMKECKAVLQNYEVVVYAPVPEALIREKVTEFIKETGIATRIIPSGTAHQEILALHGQARVSIGLSMSDGISTSFLEALVMGSFPIQSNTACANEWVESGKTGMIVPPEDREAIKRALQIALTDDRLVDQAAQENWQTAQKKLGYSLIAQKSRELYEVVSGQKSLRDCLVLQDECLVCRVEEGEK